MNRDLRNNHGKESGASPGRPSAPEEGADSNAEGAVDGREGRIALAAYYRAHSRGFMPGRELDDWLAAEAEIDGAGLEEIQNVGGGEDAQPRTPLNAKRL